MKRVPPSSATTTARFLRSNPTDAEKRMWRLLREAFPEVRFRRQVPIRQYIVDFASHRAKVVIEVDGGQHHELIDAARSAVIEADGYRLIRFWNNDVLNNAEGVHNVIAEVLAESSPPPNPPPSTGRA
jgi:very-short-patch-repair endonuclease